MFKVGDNVETLEEIQVIRNEKVVGKIYKIETDKWGIERIYFKTYPDGHLRCFEKHELRKQVNENMRIIKAKIVKVLDKSGEIPKHRKYWNLDVVFTRKLIELGYQGLLFYDSGQRMIRTSYIENIKEDENNLVIHTQNSIYHIKKILE